MVTLNQDISVQQLSQTLKWFLRWQRWLWLWQQNHSCSENKIDCRETYRKPLFLIFHDNTFFKRMKMKMQLK